MKGKSRNYGTVFDRDFIEKIEKEIKELKDFETFSKNDESIKREIKERISSIIKNIEAEKIEKRFGGKHDRGNAFLSIYSGTGGRDAEDWVKIIYRMYQRFLSKNNLQFKEIEKTTGEGGIKSVTLKIKGKNAFGWLKEENGVHRLVRISPFSAKKLRHTSFASVEVLPEIKSKEIEIKDSELKTETFRASGAGGQYVNRRESAIRLTHLPTGISVSSQAERLQGENKKIALSILEAKLFNIKKTKEKETAQKERGELSIAKWGNQIRSYVFQPYQMVKDHRTGIKTSNLNEVLDGNLEKFTEI